MTVAADVDGHCCRATTVDGAGSRLCLKCCYASVEPAAAGRRRADKKATAAAVADRAADEYDREPPSEAAAFVAAASAAAFVLLAALLAIILSSAALWTVVSVVPTATGATANTRAADYVHQWHWTHRPYPHQQPRRRNDVNGGESRDKRQLLFKKNREPGVIALTFSLIGGTVSDVREAYRNVTGIVRETINEAARPPTSTAATADGDQMMMAAGNAVENEISSGTTAAAPPVDERVAGTTLGKLLGRNYRGLRRLFNSELRSALKNSPGNVRDFTLELMGSIGQSLRPSQLFSRGSIDNSASTASTTTR